MEPIDGPGKPNRLTRKQPQARITVNKREPARANGAETPFPLAALEQHLRVQLRQLQQRDASPETVAQALIGTVLAWEFKDKSTNEPKFNLLVEQVSRCVRESPQLDAALQEIAAALRERP
jgi:hypothetical protein